MTQGSLKQFLVFPLRNAAAEDRSTRSFATSRKEQTDGRVRTRPRSLSQLYWSSTSIYPVINNETAVLTGHSTPTTSPLVKTKLYLFLFITVNANAHARNPTTTTTSLVTLQQQVVRTIKRRLEVGATSSSIFLGKTSCLGALRPGIAKVTSILTFR